MTYAGDEVSVRGGKPNELYKFSGTYSTYRYTSGPEAIDYDDDSLDENGDPLGPETYLPIAIERTAVNAGTQDDDKLDLVITISVTHQIVMDYGFQDTPPSLQLTIYRYHTLADVVPYWYGPVDNIKVNQGKAQIRSYSKLSAALSQSFPNVYYQAPCNHTLYNPRCGVSYAANSADVVIVSVVGRTITIDNMPGTLDGQLVGGEVKLASGERRMISAQAGEVLTVNFPFYSLAEDDTVTIAKGCNLAYRGDCKTKFGNQLRFGGFPFIPAENPFTEGIESGTAIDDNTCPPPAFQGLVTVYNFNVYDPCNPTYGATRQLYFPETQPNAPHGKILSAFNGLPANGISYIYENDDFVNPASAHYQDPAWANCRGQILVDFNMANLAWTVTFHFSVNSGDWLQRIQYPAFFCGSVGKDHGLWRISVCRNNPPEDPDCMLTGILEGEVAGNTPYDFVFTF